jgi:PPOX class probable FMN-dependent enzyme
MGRHFAEIAFTPRVQAEQARIGSRAGYARMAERGRDDTRLTEAEAAFLAGRDSFYMATVSETGWPYVQHRGGPPGFVRVLDERTLAIPDRPGNRRYDTYRNLFANSSVGLIFIVPAVEWTLRVSGKAIVVRDPGLREALAERGKLPDQVLVVAVERVLAHCPKCMIRSGLWKPDAWPATGDVPSLAETLIAHATLPEPIEQVSASLEQGNRERLY